jgi:UDP-glucose:(heptosyl)LPS alpha-1,3-glucosyltransferase
MMSFKPMRLIYVCRNCTLLGGQSRIAWELGKRALAEGHDVHLVARRFPPGMENSGVQKQRVFQLPPFVGEWTRFRFFADLASKRADKLARGGGVVHGFGDSYRQHIITLGNVDWNYARHLPGRQPERTAVYVKKRAFLDPGLRMLVLVSKQMRQDILDLLPNFDSSKFRIIYPGVDPQRFRKHSREEIRSRLGKEFGIPTGARWLVFAAGGDFEKRNMKTMGQALLKLRDRDDWRMLFVGARKDQFPWPKELEDRSYFLGRLDDIGTVLPGCDLMVYPAWYDESPLSCLEAMASGLPLVVSRTVGTSEIISEDNKATGILDDPGNADKLAQLIGGMLSNETLRRRIGEENRKAAEGFSWEAIYRQYRDLYEEVAAFQGEKNHLSTLKRIS